LNFILFFQNWIPWSVFRLLSNRWFSSRSVLT
jgi:hypothetical protein